MHVMPQPGQIKSQVREELACGGLVGEEESVDEDDFHRGIGHLRAFPIHIHELIGDFLQRVPIKTQIHSTISDLP